MAGTTTLRGSQLHATLADAIERRTTIALTHRSPAGWTAFVSCFRAVDASKSFILLDPVVARREGACLPLDQEVGVSFRLGHRKCFFSAQLVDRSGREVSRHALTWPERIDQLRRRSYERVAPPPGHPIAVRFRCVARAENEVPGDYADRYGELEDISAGGMRVTVSSLDSIFPDGTYRCMFSPREAVPPIVVEAVPRHHEAASGGRVSLGLHFVGLEASADGRSVLNRLSRLVAEFQRNERATERRSVG